VDVLCYLVFSGIWVCLFLLDRVTSPVLNTHPRGPAFISKMCSHRWAVFQDLRTLNKIKGLAFHHGNNVQQHGNPLPSVTSGCNFTITLGNKIKRHIFKPEVSNLNCARGRLHTKHTHIKPSPTANSMTTFNLILVKGEINGRGDPLCWPSDTLYPQKLALTSLTSGGLSVGIVRLRTKATKNFLGVTGSNKNPASHGAENRTSICTETDIEKKMGGGVLCQFLIPADVNCFARLHL
jgi:hypothetical protein